MFFERGAQLRLAYQVFDAPKGRECATPLLMIQGLTGVKEDWGELAVELSRVGERQLVCMDNRGMGESSVPEEQWSLEDMADDALALAAHLGLRRFHVMGISMGGMIAQLCYHRAPRGTIERVVLGCTHHGGVNLVTKGMGDFLRALKPPHRGKLSAEEKERHVGRVQRFNLTEAWADRHADAFAAIVARTLATTRSVRGMVRQAAAIAAFDAEARVKELDVPTLVIHGDEDRVIAFANGERLATMLPYGSLLRMPGVGHAFWMMEPAWTARSVAAFLRGDAHGMRKYPSDHQTAKLASRVRAMAQDGDASDGPVVMVNILRLRQDPADAAQVSSGRAGGGP